MFRRIWKAIRPKHVVASRPAVHTISPLQREEVHARLQELEREYIRKYGLTR